MKINQIQLTNFRLIKSLNKQITNNQVIIIGDNASGKTSIVEAIYYACFLTSFRSNKKEELISFEEKITSINIKYEKKNLNKIEIYFTNDKQNILINDNVCKSRLDIIGNLKVLMLSPQFDEYVSGSPKIRRKFINMHISQYDKEYSHYLSKYQRITKQRNSLLKTNNIDIDLLEVITNEYNKLIEVIRAKRISFLNDLEKYGKSIVNILSVQEDQMTLEYIASKKVDINKEILFKKTLYGLQYDDFLIKINTKDAKKYCSQGQKRTISIALILAQLEMIKKQIGEYPIVIIDDVHIELDKKRQQVLFEILDTDIQTFFISATSDSIPDNIMQKADVIKAQSKGVFK